MEENKNNRPTITAHCIVKNEEYFVNAAIMSVLPYVDKMIIFDAGSTDKTISIIKKISQSKGYKNKIHFEVKGDADKTRHTELRNQMIKMTKTDWFMVLDGDEVWPAGEIDYVVNYELLSAKKLNRKCIVVPYHLASIDLYHYTTAGHYGFPWGLHGHFTPRFFQHNSGVVNWNWSGGYGDDTIKYKGIKYSDTRSMLYFSSAYFWHLSKLKRSSQGELRIDGLKKSKKLPNLIKKLFLPRAGEIPEILQNEKN